jgi:hypothetical protein
MSKLMRQQCHAEIIGVERNPQAAWQAQRHCHYVFTENLDEPASLDMLEGEDKFDTITLVDVLEHLQHPMALLERLKPLLLPEGRILLSVPNIAHASVRLELLNGHFSYEQAGILDATHLKFFTVDTLQEMLVEAGYAVHEIDYTWHDLPDEVIANYLTSACVDVTPEALAAFHTPEAMAYQFIFSISPASAPAPQRCAQVLKPLDDSWRTWRRTQGDLQEAEQHTQALQQELIRERQCVAHLVRELETIQATRSWQMLRKGASAWRDIQSRFT